MREPGRENGSGRTRAPVICFDFANTMRAASMSVTKELCAKAASLSLVAARSTGVNLYERLQADDRADSWRFLHASKASMPMMVNARRVFVHHALHLRRRLSPPGGAEDRRGAEAAVTCSGKLAIVDCLLGAPT